MLFFLANIIHWVFLIYTLFLLVRVVGSWFPSFSGHQIMRFVAFYTDPYLNMFRRVIPPIGGVLDLSPLLGFFALQIAENLLLFILSCA
jgi:YggT family protein